MKQLQTIVSKDSSKVKVVQPISHTEITERKIDYPNMTKKEFAKKYRNSLYNDITINIDDKDYTIQVNHCLDPFCSWFGLAQQKYNNLKHNPSRYFLIGQFSKKSITCNNIDDGVTKTVTPQTYVGPLSNWSLALEIKRLIDINTVIPLDPKYSFHRDECLTSKATPFDNPKGFYKRGKSTSNSQKYQCKVCKKITNVLPSQRESFTYYQQRNDILPSLMMQILNRTPVTRTMEILGIGASTYYNKIEWINKKCLEFLDKHETKQLSKKHFKSLWLTTDKFSYYLNNIRKKGHANNDFENVEKPHFQTFIVATVDSYSRYAFRTDLAYDYNITAEELVRDAEELKEDHLFNFAQKNGRYRYSYYSTKQKQDDEIDLNDLTIRKDYIDGIHVNATYTAFSQYWILRQLLNVEKINYVTDDDITLINSIKRANIDGIKDGTINIFTASIDRKVSKKESYRLYSEKVKELKDWRENNGFKCTLKEAAIANIAEELNSSPLYKKININGTEFTERINNNIEHPYPYKDEGGRNIKCYTDLSHLTSEEFARLLYKVDMRAINTYFNQIRRRISILERPLVTARGEGKSYIYSNFNPKYAQYMLTIVRTYLNFCQTFKYKKKDVTPAMLLGIAERPYTIREILYS